MKIAIRTHDVTLTEALRALVTRRLSSAFDRLGPTVRAVDVTLSDVNGPRGGVDKHCRLRVHSDTAAPVVSAPAPVASAPACRLSPGTLGTP